MREAAKRRTDLAPSVMAATKAIFEGKDAASVLDMLRKNGKGSARTLGSYRTVVSQARQFAIQNLKLRHARYEETAEAFRDAVRHHPEAECDKKMEEFFALPLAQQVAMQRRYGGGRGARGAPEGGWSKDKCLSGQKCEAVDEAFREIALLPDNVAGLHLSPSESDEVSGNAIRARRTKNEEVDLSSDAGGLLRRCREVVKQRAAAGDGGEGAGGGMAHLAVCLILLSGRRMTEILSPRSSFRACPDSEFACLFTGQLKKKQSSAAPHAAAGGEYCIPLLIDFPSFDAGIKALRAAQASSRHPHAEPAGGKRKRGDWASKSNAQMAKYSSNLTKAMRLHFTEEMLSRTATPHTLRALYARMVFEAFDCGRLALPAVVQICLGHADLTQSLHYMSTAIENFESFRKSCGKFPCWSSTSKKD